MKELNLRSGWALLVRKLIEMQVRQSTFGLNITVLIKKLGLVGI